MKMQKTVSYQYFNDSFNLSTAPTHKNSGGITCNTLEKPDCIGTRKFHHSRLEDK